MRWTCLILLVCAPGLAAERKTHSLPKDPGAEVVRFEYRGGFRAPRKDDAPRMSILADGTVRVARPHGTLKAKLTGEELQQLLRFAIDEHRIFEFDAKSVREEIRKQKGDQPIVLDAADTVITIRLRKRKAVASFHALQFAATQYPKIKALQDLRAIERRLENLVQIFVGGGRAEVEKLMRRANEELKRQQPKVAPLELEELVRADVWKNKGRDLLFQRRVGRRLLRVSVHAPPSKEPQILIEFPPAR
ncbi:MAG: hypothetical protein ACYTGV_02235 [Planctomycetota bacterium]|jgi:hypothetical protein